MFGVDAIPLHLRVTREILVFLVELIRIAPRAVVDAIATLRVALRALSATAATAAGLPIIHPRLMALVSRSLTRSGPINRCGVPVCFAQFNAPRSSFHGRRTSAE